MKKLFIGLLFLLVSLAPVSAAEDFTLWSSQTFTSPYTGNVIATSAEIANAQDLDSVRIFVEYENITPDVCGCNISAILEEEIVTNVWVAVAAQNQAYAVEGNGPKRVIVLSPGVVINPGSDFIVEGPDGKDTKISNHQGSAPGNFRIRLIMPAAGNLTSITVTGVGRKFNQ